MWEDLTVALCCLGFLATIALLIVEVPAVLGRWSHQPWSPQRDGQQTL